MVSKHCGFKIVARNVEDPIYSTIFADEEFYQLLHYYPKFLLTILHMVL